METLDEVLGAFEEALELERELGTRTIPCDRALLMPVQVSGASCLVPGAVEEVPGARCLVPGAVPSLNVAPSTPPPAPSTTPLAPSTKHQAPGTTPLAPSTKHQAPSTPLTDFAFIVTVLPQGAAATLLDKMIAAMGYTREQVTLVTASAAAQAHPAARVYVVLGSDAFRTFAPGQRAALGLWTRIDEVPTVVTYSPARILAYFGNDEAGLKKAKMQIWNDLRAALAQIGKKPPVRSR